MSANTDGLAAHHVPGKLGHCPRTWGNGRSAGKDRLRKPATCRKLSTTQEAPAPAPGSTSAGARLAPIRNSMISWLTCMPRGSLILSEPDRPGHGRGLGMLRNRLPERLKARLAGHTMCITFVTVGDLAKWRARRD